MSQSHSKSIPMLDLSDQFDFIRTEVMEAISRVCESQHFILGPEVEQFEAEIAAYCGSRHAIGVSSGTDAILLALMGLGIGPGDEVVTTPYTFFATAGSIVRLGAHPIFIDIDPGSFNLLPSRIAKSLSPRTKAILPVHLFGQCADMEEITAIGNAAGVPVIEDAAQAIGAKIHGRHAGTFGLCGAFSFFPSKNLGAFGDAGLITTDDSAFAEKLKMMRAHGMSPRYYHRVVGGNFRLDAIQAAVLRVKLKYLNRWTEQRRKNAKLYTELLGPNCCCNAMNQRPTFELPTEEEGSYHVFNQFVVKCSHRDELREHLLSSGIVSEVYYPLPMHLQECFKYLGHGEGDYPVSERVSRESLALPIFPELGTDRIQIIAKSILEFFDQFSKRST